jgi:hypothetical protein
MTRTPDIRAPYDCAASHLVNWSRIIRQFNGESCRGPSSSTFVVDAPTREPPVRASAATLVREW